MSDIAIDAVTTPAADATTFSHAGGANPRGVAVYAVQENDSTDRITGVTYGGVAMTEVAGSPLIRSASEIGVVYCYVLYSGIPTGTQQVVVSYSAGPSIQCFAITLNADNALESLDVDATMNSSSQANPSVTLGLASRKAFCLIGFFSGHGAVGSITPTAGWTSQLEVSFSARTTAGFYTYDTIGTADVAAGWTQTAEDATMIALAIAETQAQPGFIPMLPTVSRGDLIIGKNGGSDFDRRTIGAADTCLRSDGTEPQWTDMAATQAEQEAASSVVRYATPGRQQYHPSAAKFWIFSLLSGGVPQNTASYNVTSLSDDATGQTTITIATDFSSANWCCVPGGAGGSTVSGAAVQWCRSFAAGSVVIMNGDLSATPVIEDPATGYTVVGYGDQ